MLFAAGTNNNREHNNILLSIEIIFFITKFERKTAIVKTILARAD